MSAFSSLENANFKSLNISDKPEKVRRILVYGRQLFALTAFCGLLGDEFPTLEVSSANSRQGLGGMNLDFLDLVVVTTSAALNQRDMDSLAAVLSTANNQPGLVILGDVGLATKSAQALLLNLRAVFPDETAPETVVAGLRFILAGGHYFPREINGIEDSAVNLAPVSQVGPSAYVAPLVGGHHHSSFTARELAVLNFLAKGISNKAIARSLSIAENTTKIHVRAILRKLECTNRTEAAILAQRLNLINST